VKAALVGEPFLGKSAFVESPNRYWLEMNDFGRFLLDNEI